jgi:histidinol dehydrogenase
VSGVVKRLDWHDLTARERAQALARPARRGDRAVADVVRRIFEEVEAQGAAAVRDWSLKLDGQAPRRIELDAAAVDAARAALAAEDLAALDLAVDNVRRFHAAIAPVDGPSVEIAPGVCCRRVWRPIRAAGLYVPGGTAPLFSTLLMLALPAAAAGVAERIAVTPPPRGEAEPHPMMLAAAAACGLDALWLVGGAQAIAALSFGAGLPKADKLFGPGNAYVAEAKRYAAGLPGGPAIDLPAGPSELLVIADASADAAIVAADLLSQAEHDADAQVVLVATDATVVDAVWAEVERQLANLPRRDIAARSLDAAVAIVATLDEAVEAANAYAPEHLSLQVADPERLVPLVASAGTVFVGRWAAETFGDYVSGPSHVLPTDGAARVFSGVSVASFMTSLVVQQVTREGAAALAPAAARLARLEGLEAHARAADLRAAS